MNKALVVVGYDNERTKQLATKLETAGYEVTVQDAGTVNHFNGLSYDFIVIDEESKAPYDMPAGIQANTPLNNQSKSTRHR